VGQRWQPFVVAAGLLAPPVVLAVAVRPAAARDGEDGGDDTSLAVGEEAGGTVGSGVASFEITATEDGSVRIDVLGRGNDPTLTVVDEEGDELAFNDDTDGLDPSIALDLDAGEVVHAQVRSFSGVPIAFTIQVTATGRGDGGDDDEGAAAGAVPA
jgi:hypothetical protein